MQEHATDGADSYACWVLRQGCCRKKKETNDLETLETAILERTGAARTAVHPVLKASRTLIKLGGLLALGFGEDRDGQGKKCVCFFSDASKRKLPPLVC